MPTDEGNSLSAEHTEGVASVISHELAHQWFGNLVTMRWWDDLWLKEGFATFMSYTAIQKVCFFKNFDSGNKRTVQFNQKKPQFHRLDFPKLAIYGFLCNQ